MNHPCNFARSLQRIQQNGHMSLTRFAEMLQVPKSTLQSILKHGQTSLETACKISTMLQTPLSVLVDDTYPQQEFDIVLRLLRDLDWYSALPTTSQESVIHTITHLLEVIMNAGQSAKKNTTHDSDKASGDDDHPESAA